MAEGLRYAGDIDITSVNIISTKDQLHSITDQVMSIELYEDIFSPFLSGKILVRDSHEFTSLLPLVGEEILVLFLKTPGLDIEYKHSFFIYKMSERMIVSTGNEAYTLYFMSKEGILDQNRKISKGYNGLIAKSRPDPKTPPGSGDVTDISPATSTTYPCIVEAIISDELSLGNEESVKYKAVFIEDSETRIRYVSNFWSPVQNLNYLAESAISASGSPTYVFFENNLGFNFVSIASLYQKPSIQEFIYLRDETYFTDPNEAYKQIIKFNTTQNYDYMKRLQSGMYGSEIISYDIMTKQYAHVGFKPVFTENPHLNKYDAQSKEPPAHHRAQIIMQPKYYNNFDDYKDVTNFRHLQNRLGLLAAAESFKMEITVNGRLDYTVGQIVNLKFPLMTQQSEALTKTQDAENKIYSGKYIISALNHKISRRKHFCIMEVIKDSYMVNVEEVFYAP